MSDLLAKQGIYFDEVDKVCILEPEISKQTNDLKEICQNYIESNTFISFLLLIWSL